jgi:hypothetical protein
MFTRIRELRNLLGNHFQITWKELFLFYWLKPAQERLFADTLRVQFADWNFEDSVNFF